MFPNRKTVAKWLRYLSFLLILFSVRYELNNIVRIFDTIQIKRTDRQDIIDTALSECVRKKLFSATDFVDMVQYIERQRQMHITNRFENRRIPVKPLEVQNESIFYTTTQQRDINEYVMVLEGQK